MVSVFMNFERRDGMFSTSSRNIIKKKEEKKRFFLTLVKYSFPSLLLKSV
jgi:hypothetical protein